MLHHNESDHLNDVIMETMQIQSGMLVAAEVELIYKSQIKVSQRPKITSAKDAYHVLRNSWNEDEMELRESFKIMLVNQCNRVLGVYEVSKGGLTSVTIDIRMIFTAALKANAAGIILAHNHPSGQLIPSHADRHFTERVKMAGKIMEIQVIDHLILTSESFISFADQGYM